MGIFMSDKLSAAMTVDGRMRLTGLARVKIRRNDNNENHTSFHSLPLQHFIENKFLILLKGFSSLMRQTLTAGTHASRYTTIVNCGKREYFNDHRYRFLAFNFPISMQNPLHVIYGRDFCLR